MSAPKEPDFEVSSPQMVLPAAVRNFDPPLQVANANVAPVRATTGQGYPAQGK